jgi:hypothetical protein
VYNSLRFGLFLKRNHTKIIILNVGLIEKVTLPPAYIDVYYQWCILVFFKLQENVGGSRKAFPCKGPSDQCQPNYYELLQVNCGIGTRVVAFSKNKALILCIWFLPHKYTSHFRGELYPAMSKWDIFLYTSTRIPSGVS